MRSVPGPTPESILAVDVLCDSYAADVSALKDLTKEFTMTEEQKELLSQTAASVVRDAMTSRNPPSDVELKRIALAAVDALTAVFEKINGSV